jgi:hypothetical protein
MSENFINKEGITNKNVKHKLDEVADIWLPLVDLFRNYSVMNGSDSSGSTASAACPANTMAWLK